MQRFTRSMLLVVVLLIATASSALAGGWAVITVDDLPDEIAAGQSFTIGFTVRQHGRTLRDDLTPLLRFDRSDMKDSFIATAKPSGESGHYVAEITLPSAGQWRWKVDLEQFGMLTQDMAPLTVLASAPVPAPASVPKTAPESAAEPSPANAPPTTTTVPVTVAANTLPLMAGVAGAIVALGALALWLRTRARLALIVVAVAGLIGVIGFTTAGTSVAQPVAANQTTSLTQPPAVDKQASVAQPAAAKAKIATTDQVAMGRALFSNKGCVMCHAHPEVTTIDGPFWNGDEPPSFTPGKYTAAYLQQWLKEPSKLKPNTEMPNLHLSDADIAALSAFLGAK